MKSGVYQEKWLGTFGSILLMLLSIAVLFMPWRLNERELFREEEAYAAQAAEIRLSRPLALAHGVVLRNSYPMYPMAAAVLHRYCNLQMESALRLTSLGMLLALGILAFAAAKLARDYRAGLVALAVITANVLSVDKITGGYPFAMTTFWIFAAHLSIFHFGMRMGKWNMTWIFSLSLASLAFYSGGISALVFYIFPLLFLRRPLSLGSRINKPGAYCGIFIFLCTLLLWMIPRLLYAGENGLTQTWQFSGDGLEEYLRQIAFYPFDLLSRFLPWSLLCWIVLCVALFNVDETPLFSRFLRTLLFANFFLLWFWPGQEPGDMLILAGPFAVLLGINYQMAMRRYGWKVRKIAIFTAEAAILVCGGCILCFYLLPAPLLEKLSSWSKPFSFRSEASQLIPGVAAGAIVLLLAAFLHYRSRKNIPVWYSLLLAAVSGAAFFWTVGHPYRALDNEKRLFGGDLKSTLAQNGGEKAMVYKLDIADLYGEFYYAGHRVRKIASLNDLPAEQKEVFLITTGFPQQSSRTWKNLLPADYTYRGRRIQLWKGVLREDGEVF